jgi:hypothetical protein
MIRELLTNYNDYMVSILGTNDFLISAITLIMMGMGTYMLRAIPNTLYIQFKKYLSLYYDVSIDETMYTVNDDLTGAGLQLDFMSKLTLEQFIEKNTKRLVVATI